MPSSRSDFAAQFGIAGAVLMVVQPGERNAFDQRWLEFALWETHGIKLLRHSLAEIEAIAELRDDFALIVDGHQVCLSPVFPLFIMQIAVAYFRSGYTPRDYPSEVEWNARIKIERSRCIKSPNIADHLSGSKKIQQVLGQPEVLKKFASLYCDWLMFKVHSRRRDAPRD